MPFAGYENFEDCVRQNQEKEYPEAFCAWLHFHTTGEWPAAASTKGQEFELPVELIEKVCPACAEKARGLGIQTLKVSTKQMPLQLLAGLCESFGGVEGFWTSCVEGISGDIADPEAFCAWLHYECHGIWPAEAASKSDEGTLGGPIVWKNSQKQVVTGVVLVPGESDGQGDILTRDEIEDFAYDYMENWRRIDNAHSLEELDAIPVESYLSPMPMTVKFDDKNVHLPVGTWIQSTKIRDREAWQKVENGQFGGYSFMVVPESTARAAFKEWPGVAAKALPPEFKRVTISQLRSLGERLYVPFVSLCETPMVPKARFFAMKAQEHQGGAVKRGLDKLLRRENGGRVIPVGTTATKEGRVLSERNKQKLMEARRVIDEVLRLVEGEGGSEMDEKQLAAVVGKAVEDSLESLNERLNVLEGKITNLEQDKGGDEDEEGQDQLTEEVASLKAKLEELETTAKEREGEFEEFQKQLADKLQTVVAKQKTAPRGGSGQDGDEGGQAATKGRDRDILGRKIKS